MMLSAHNPLKAGKSYRIKEGIGYPSPWSPLRTRVVHVLNVVHQSALSAMYAVTYTEYNDDQPRHRVHGAVNQGIGEHDSYRVVAFEELIPIQQLR
ncbi:MAG: hypothetical protein GY833_23070 [Aestuariibacter sp.]|nr:hypothetical protein [Aestuariibacter sp.]